MAKHLSGRALLALVALSSLVALAALLPAGGLAFAEEGGPSNDPASDQWSDPPSPPGKDRYQRLDSHLNRLVEQLGQQAPAAIAPETPFHQGASVAVTIHLAGNVPAIAEFLEANGGLVANVGADYLEAYVPVTQLVALEQQPGVLRVMTILPPHPAVTSEGTTVHGSPAWNAAGLTGDGVKVGVIDVGFQGLATAIAAGELPVPVMARCYTGVGNFTSDPTDCENGEEHGTAVAEAVVDIAPGVSLYIADPVSMGGLKATAAWMVEQGVQVVNHSVSWSWTGPGDGTSPYSWAPTATVDSAVAGGVLWVNSAGNDAQANWYGAFSDSDGDGWLNFSGGDETQSLSLQGGQRITAQLRWDDSWDAASSDLDLRLYDASFNLLTWSVTGQGGAPGDTPYESFSYVAPATGTYHVAVHRFAGAIPSWVQLTVRRANLEYPVAARSITNPAESPNQGLLAVGAADWSTPGTIESFSSQGPTTDGRVKPDIVGVDNGNSLTSGHWRGTSQASPHVAGLAALVLQRSPGFTPAQVAAYLKARALPRGAVPNSTWGYGLAHLPAVQVVATTDQTANEGSAVSVDMATFTNDYAGATHTATIDWGDGTTEAGTVSESGGSGTVSGSHAYADNGVYTVTLTVTDDDGGVGSDTLTVTVTNVAPTVEAGSDQQVNEGATVSLGGSFDDPGTADTHTLEWDFGDGATTSGSLTPTHAYADNGVYTVTLTITDDDGGVGSDTLTVTVTNVAPTVEAGGDQQVNEGATVSLGGSFDDPGTADTHTLEWDFGDGATTSGSLTPTHAYADNGVYTVTLTVTDDDGGVGSDTLTVTVTNVAPTVDAGSDQQVNEGATVSFGGSFDDPGAADTHTLEWVFGDGATTSGSLTPTHAYADNGVYTVTLTVTDDDGGVGSDTLTVTVTNVAPTVSTGVVGPINLYVGMTSGPIIVATFSDPDPADTHTATIDWGDGTVEEATVHQPTRSVGGSHVYADPGEFQVRITVTDDDGGSGSAVFMVNVSSAPVVLSVPSANQWGLMAMAGLMASLALRRLRRMNQSRSS